MSAWMLDALLRCSPRERLLLGLAAMLLPLAVFFLVLMPLAERRDASNAALQEARALTLWLQERISEKQALTQVISSPQGAPSAGPIGPGGLEQKLIDARLRPALSALSTEAGGVLDLRFDRVDFAALARWLAEASTAWGYRIDSFRFDALPDDPGYVTAFVTLSPG